MSRFSGEYPADWPAIAKRVKDEANWLCVRCGHPHEPTAGYTLTVHHLTGDRTQNQWWNLAALDQRCHLQIQAKVVMNRPWLYEHSEWFKIFAGGYFAWKYLGLCLSREEVMTNLEYYAGLEARTIQEGI